MKLKINGKYFCIPAWRTVWYRGIKNGCYVFEDVCDVELRYKVDTFNLDKYIEER